KAPAAIEAPKAVIKALYDYERQADAELSFTKGDFFHVVGPNGTSDPHWFDACNPATGQRGLVPAQFFQVLGRQARETSGDGGMQRVGSSGAGASRTKTRGHARQPSSKASPLYGVVQYDFTAERPDELEAKAGEAIIIIAQSNHEWFVAKPIGRLGGPGLIPVSFVEIRDLVTGKTITNLEELAAKAAVPKVEEWKKAAAEYKNSSIPLGRFDFDMKQDQSNVRRSDYSSSSNPEELNRRKSSPDLYVARASVDQFLVAEDRYWFLVRVEMNDGRHRNLCRFYEDFYDFQIKLLDEFPIEAGRTGEQRILPFMPGPLAYVDETISAQRRADLHIYVEELCRLPAHIVRSPLLQGLFSAREGDVESIHATSMMPQPLPQASKALLMPSATLSNNSVPRGSSAGNAANNVAMLKVKVHFDDDLIAIRVPSDILFDRLLDKLKERLSGDWSRIRWKD
ncbi:hypothetical protein BCR37DRAFT_330745, partial [Protomyces lactucae-debilis]